MVIELYKQDDLWKWNAPEIGYDGEGNSISEALENAADTLEPLYEMFE